MNDSVALANLARVLSDMYDQLVEAQRRNAQLEAQIASMPRGEQDNPADWPSP